MEWQEIVLELREIAQVQTLEKQLQQLMTDLEMPAEKQLDLRLCLLEAVHNGIIHGNQEQADKKVTVCWRYRKGEFIFSVTDEGEGFTPQKEVNLPEDILAEDGRGLMLLQLLLDKIWYNESGNTLNGQLTWLAESGDKV